MNEFFMPAIGTFIRSLVTGIASAVKTYILIVFIVQVIDQFFIFFR